MLTLIVAIVALTVAACLYKFTYDLDQQNRSVIVPLSTAILLTFVAFESFAQSLFDFSFFV